MNRNKEYEDYRKRVINVVRTGINAEGNSIGDERVREMIDKAIFSDRSLCLFTALELKRLFDTVFYSIRCELSVLSPLIDDDEISEIMVNGPENIYVERKGKIEKAEICFESCDELERVIQRVAGKVHREINEGNPILDARLSGGARVNAVYKNIALNGPSLSIRKFPETALTMADIIEGATITQEAADYLKTLVKAGYNLFISGGTSSGKTTFLNILSEFIPKEARVVVIEDSAELQLRGIDNFVRLECRNANNQGKGEINMETLIKNSLRMRPDWIIVGEVRGGECAAMLQAMNTGHYGLSTGHANSIEGMLRRMEAMYLQRFTFPASAIREQIVQGIDIIIHLGRISEAGRKVLEIAEIQGLDGNKFIINSIFKYKVNKGLVPTGNSLERREKLLLSGLSL